MKTKSAVLLAATFLAATGATHANSIYWSIDNADLLDVDPIQTATTADWQFVFLTEDNGALTDNGGANSDVMGFEDGVNEGTWEDSLGSSAEYVIALWDGVAGTQYYIIKDGDDYVTISAAAFEDGWSSSAGLPGAEALEEIVQKLADGDYVAEAESATDEPLTQRPTISAFAVSGTTATLTISDAVSGAWYAVFSSTTLDASAAKTRLGEAQQASGETVVFTNLDATGDAKFYFVAGASTKAGAETWE